MFSALCCLVLMTRILICKGQGTDYEDICVPKGTNYVLNLSTNITVNMTTCRYYEIYVLTLLMNSTEENVSPRPISIPLQELKAQSTAVGTIAEDTQQKFQLGNISFRSTVKKRNTSSHDEFEVHLKLEVMISESATSCQLFDLIKLVVRCLLDVNSLGTRHEAGHYSLVYYNETSEGCPTLNSTGIYTQAGLPVTPTPDSGSSEEKKNPPGEGPTLLSTGITLQAGLPDPTPDSGSSEEKKTPPDVKRATDGSTSLALFHVFLIVQAVFISLVSGSLV